jgi:hypothetical protein
MELRESADGLRWVIGTSWHDGCYLAADSRKQRGELVGKTQPDVHLIKQVEQVTTSALGGPDVALRPDSEHEGHGRRRNPVFLIWQLLHWLLFGCKNSQKRPRATGGNAAGFHEPGHMGCRAVALPNSVRLIHNRGNLACCPDFKVESLPENPFPRGKSKNQYP